MEKITTELLKFSKLNSGNFAKLFLNFQLNFYWIFQFCQANWTEKLNFVSVSYSYSYFVYSRTEKFRKSLANLPEFSLVSLLNFFRSLVNLLPLGLLSKWKMWLVQKRQSKLQWVKSSCGQIGNYSLNGFFQQRNKLKGANYI